MIPNIETQPVKVIKSFQEKLLHDQLIYLKYNSKFYSRLFDKNKINVDKIICFENLTNIPVTTKDDLQNNTRDFYCVKEEKVIDYITTSGTVGEPITFIMTDKDLDRLAYNESISLSCSDCSAEDIFQITTTIDRRFMAGLAYFLGARKLGAGVVRVGYGMPEFQWDTVKRISPTTLIVVPTFLLKLIEYAEENGIDYKNSSIKKAVCIGDALRDGNLEYNIIAKNILEKWDIRLYSTYASTEMATAFNECSHGCGGHHHPELIIVEFLDDDNNPVKEGELGEITISTLGVEGLPLLRFKTGDVCYFYTDPCACGRTTMRLGPVVGRKQQMIKFRGTTLYPSSLYNVLNNVNGIEIYYVEVFTNQIGTDEILIHIGCKSHSADLEDKIKDHFRTNLRVVPQLLFEETEMINSVVYAESNRKAKTLVDKRKKI